MATGLSEVVVVEKEWGMIGIVAPLWDALAYVLMLVQFNLCSFPLHEL